MIQVRILYVYFFAVCMIGTSFSYAMEQIDRKKIAQMMNETMSKIECMSKVGEKVPKETIATVKHEILAIAQAANMPDREEIITDSMIMDKYHRDYAKLEPYFEERHAQSQEKELKRMWPDYMRTVPYDCTVVVKKKDAKGETDIGEYHHTMHANKYNIKDAEDVILIAIREYTRDYSKREDGKLNADQRVECTITFGDVPSDTNTFSGRAGDAWQLLEKIMTDHLERALKK